MDTIREYVTVDSDEEWEDSAAAKALLVFTAAAMIFGGFRIWASLEPASIFGFSAVFLMYGGAVQLLVLAVTDVNMERYGRYVAYAVIAVLVLSLLAALARAFLPKLSTDAMMFSAYSTELVMHGENPYTQSMKPAFLQEGVAAQFSTPRIDGTTVHSFSYPAGAVLAFVPQAATVGRTQFGLRLTMVVVAGLCTLLLAYYSPPQLAIGGVAAMIGSRNLLFTAAGGVLDPLWLLPLLGSMIYWQRERWTAAAVLFGVAAAMKQNPWPIAPFLGIWLYMASDSYRQFAIRAGRTITAGLGTFLLLNLPFIVADPGAWLAGVLTPVGGAAPLVHQGVGLTQTTVLGFYPLTTTWHTAAVATVVGVLLVAYALYWEQLQWAAWLMPVLIYLVHYRSLASYFTHFLPVAYMAILCKYDQLRTAHGRGPVARLRGVTTDV